MLQIVVWDKFMTGEEIVVLTDEQEKQYERAHEPLKFLKPFLPAWMTWPYIVSERKIA